MRHHKTHTPRALSSDFTCWMVIDKENPLVENDKCILDSQNKSHVLLLRDCSILAIGLKVGVIGKPAPKWVSIERKQRKKKTKETVIVIVNLVSKQSFFSFKPSSPPRTTPASP